MKYTVAPTFLFVNNNFLFFPDFFLFSRKQTKKLLFGGLSSHFTTASM